MSLHLSNEYWLEFDGVDDYVQANSNGTLNYAMPMKLDFTIDSWAGDYVPVMGKFTLGAGNDRYYIIKNTDSTFGYGGVRVQGGNNTTVRTPVANINLGQRYQLEWDEDGSDTIMKIDGVEVERETTQAIPNPTTDYYFTLGRAYSGRTEWHFEGKIYSFQIGTETFPMNEGSGTTITGSEGTVLDIYGATWGSDPIKQINEVYIEDSGVLRPVKNIYLGTSTGLKNIYQSEPTP